VLIFKKREKVRMT